MDLKKFTKWRPKYLCKYPRCKNKYYELPMPDINYKNKHFHKFPQDPERNSTWRKACGISKSAAKCSSAWYICDDHFKPEHKNIHNGRLFYNAVPGDYHTDCENEPLNFLNSTNNCKKIKLSDHDYARQLLENGDYLGHSDEEDFQFLLVDLEFPEDMQDIPTNKFDRIAAVIKTKILRLRDIMTGTENPITFIRNLYDEGKFKVIEALSKTVSKEIHTTLLSTEKTFKHWTIEENITALWIHQKSPHLYKYFSFILGFPSTNALSDFISEIPHQTGMNSILLNVLKEEVAKLPEIDRNCLLLIDELDLSKGHRYEQWQQIISGYEDLGPLGRTTNEADNALVFMVIGITKPWKQVIAYYFSSGKFVPEYLGQIINSAIEQLQLVGLRVLATLCDCLERYVATFDMLRQKNQPYFCVNENPICTIFNVEQLIKQTRDALVKKRIEVEKGQFADFAYIKGAFNLDAQWRRFPQSRKLKQEHFDFKSDKIKNSFDIAAAQLSYAVAVSIETWVKAHGLPKEATTTADFVYTFDCLLDSLSGSVNDEKPYKSPVSNYSPHLTLWIKILKDLNEWKIADDNGCSIVDAWKITITSMIYIWSTLKHDGLTSLSLKSFNKTPLDKLFSDIRHLNPMPTCHQFVKVLNTAIISRSLQEEHLPLVDLVDIFINNKPIKTFKELNEDILKCSNFEIATYISGLAVMGYPIPDECQVCTSNIFAPDFSGREVENYQVILLCASDQVVRFAVKIEKLLVPFLNLNSHINRLEDIFIKFYKKSLGETFCPNHNCQGYIADQCIKYFIHKWVKINKRIWLKTIQ